MDFLTHLLINLIFAIFLYYGLSYVFNKKIYQRLTFILFVFGAIFPDVAWLIYGMIMGSITPPISIDLFLIFQFLHSFFGQLLIWIWIAFIIYLVSRRISYEDVLFSVLGGITLHYIIDICTHDSGVFIFYPYINIDFSVGWFLENTTGVFGEITFFGLTLVIMFLMLFVFTFISYKNIKFIENRLSKTDILFLNLFLSVLLLSYWIDLIIFYSILILLVIIYTIFKIRKYLHF